MDSYFIGIDVGTGSARAGLFDRKGTLITTAAHDIKTWHPKPHHAEQSSDDIWKAICHCTKAILQESRIAPCAIKGIGFDATCSLVVLDKQGQPLTVNEQDKNAQNIILWMDHRATEQAEHINSTKAKVLDYVGGRISPEMETPKLLWLAENLPSTYQNAGYFFDLADYLTWRASGSLARSVCTLTCKWTYLDHDNGWDKNYFEEIGLADLASDGFARIGQEVRHPGDSLAQGLTPEAASDLGLIAGTAVACGIIDAHAGAIGTIGAHGLPGSLTERLAYVFGTSACTLNVTEKPSFVSGVWGPYHSALLPDMWLNEGGQSAAGAAIDYLVKLHPFYPEISQKAENIGLGAVQYLEQQAKQLLKTVSLPELLKGLHIVPEFIGNRAPFADPQARAILAGLGMDYDEKSLVRLYLAGVASLGYGLRQIIDALDEKGNKITSVVISGGAARSALVRQILADATNVSIAQVSTTEPVLLGSAMLASIAVDGTNIQEVMASMSQLEALSIPTEADQAIHKERYSAFKELQIFNKKHRSV